MSGKRRQILIKLSDVGWDHMTFWSSFFCFLLSDNYIFGKFNAFCRRLEKIADMTSALEKLAGLQSIKVA